MEMANKSRIHFDHVRNLWERALKGEVNSILEDEFNFYHSYCKNPDTGLRFRQFYSQVEPLYAFIATQSIPEARSFIQKIKFADSLLHYENIIVYKGPLHYANGNVLKTQMKNISKTEADKTLIIFINYTPKESITLSKDLGVSCMGLATNTLSKNKHELFSIIGLLHYSHSTNIRLVWWCMPFGMIFTYTLIEELKKINFFKSSQIKKEFLGVKHRFTWSSCYLDKIHAGYSCLEGYESQSNIDIEYHYLANYRESELVPSNTTTGLINGALAEQLKLLKKENYLILSSASRAEKTQDKDYLESLRKIFKCKNKIALVYFCKEDEDQSFHAFYKELAKINNNVVINAGWSKNIVDFISYIDIFLDPYPFGAGLTFASAALQLKPCISTTTFVHTSPSAISRIKFHHLRNDISIDNEFLSKYLFLDSSKYADSACDLIDSLRNGDKNIIRYCEQLKTAIFSIYISGSQCFL